MSIDQDLFLGFDLSTQQLKISITDAALKHVKTYHVEFDMEYSQKYGVSKGVIANDKTGEIVSPVLMWVEALQYTLDTMARDNFPFQNVKGVSGSCQQHGSVFWSQTGQSSLQGLSSDRSLLYQLEEAFAWKMSPNWQDHSTGEEARAFETCIGGEAGLAAITGSKAHYRFTGLQIRKLARAENEYYRNTSRISLVSSFLSSLLVGDITRIEESDACGMNLYDVVKREYNAELLSLAAGVHPEADSADGATTSAGVEALKRKLGAVEPVGHQSVGNVSLYYVEKYGFSPQCKVFAFTGDNLATILALPLQGNDLLISLGTSTTALLVTESYNPSPVYHLFMHPTMDRHYMGMICYCNGSLAREKVRDAVNGDKSGSWDTFNAVLDASSNFDKKLGVYFPLGEIAPNAAAQTMRYTLDGKTLVPGDSTWTFEDDVRCIVESQALSCRLRSGLMMASSQYSAKEQERLNSTYLAAFGDLYTDGKKQGLNSLTSTPQRCFFVGGASQNPSIVKKMASIMGASKNYRVDVSNACAMGGAYKASWSYQQEVGEKAELYMEYLNANYDERELEEISVDAVSESYIEGLGMLAKIEEQLKR
ncbi:hypothetical protein BABINDRAFT_7173 [Babjeviella inositovora NRRL Y-12698]|uniref:Xylulose kinase n=1 Tax=Babjeviella inositovora NRRL Y-12698 TaxID=984486 RepID=A0A1E3QUM0_9ASCO|nr:uncharacterized protein BABINDRAFT_7173 [Babjeviella inositovora NRRL Y-12698]ODQ81376.1 hypothetical protein BABINDRAFT_7173 [Babjeviella inositovora NRRL Y-12698]